MKYLLAFITIILISNITFSQNKSESFDEKGIDASGIAPEFTIQKVVITSSNTVKLYAYNSGAATWVNWYIAGVNTSTAFNSTQIQTMQNNSPSNIVPITLIFTGGPLSVGRTYTFFLSGGNAYGNDYIDQDFNHFQSIDPNFHNTITNSSIFYPIDNTNQILTLQNSQKQKVNAFYNSLAKPSQTVICNGSNDYSNPATLKDFISPITYNNLGLESRSLLPYTGTADGSFRPNAVSEQLTYYTNPPYSIEGSTYPFSEKSYKKTPMLEITEQSQPGLTYNLNSGHITKTSIETNADNEVLLLGIIESNSTEINILGTYPHGELTKLKTTDANQVVSYTYKDKRGLEILKSTFDGTTLIKTYYVYDRFGRLRFVIPPAAIELLPATGLVGTSHPARVGFITEYKYDGMNREIEKIMPEEKPVWTVYDPAGRVVLRQDGIMRANNDWLFTKYDSKSRVVMTGIVKLPPDWEDRAFVQTTINGLIGPGKACKYYEVNSVASSIGYTSQAFPDFDESYVQDYNIYTLNYYDKYNVDNNGPDDILFQNVGYSLTDFDEGDKKISGHTPVYTVDDKITIKKVLLFGAEGTSRVFNGDKDYNYNPPSPENIYYKGTVRLLPGFKTYPDQKVYIGPNISTPLPGNNSDGYLSTAYFYDKYGRVIQTQAQNHIGGTDVVSTQYDFSGKVIRTKNTHSTGYETVTVNDRFTYDVIGRLLNSYKKIDNLGEKLVSVNEYNELGQLITKKLDNISGEYLQTVDYRYNIRGWLKSVNDPYSFPPPDGPTDVFAYTLHYEDDAAHGISNLPLYNGNISTMTWKYYNDTRTSVYKFDYDKLNRLKSAQFGDMSNGANFTASPNYKEYDITYDKNGNIKTLKRNTYNGSLMDNLAYSYADPSDGGLGAGNKLYHVTDAVSTTAIGYDFDEVTEGNTLADYGYDDNGNMISDLNKGITITYNYLNLPTAVKWTADGRKIEWLYDATGNKLRKTVYNTTGAATNVIDYVNGFVYNTNYGDALPQLSFFGMSEGRVVKLGPNNYELQYWLKDHLGNTRIAVNRDANDDLHIIQKDFYYPFGLTVNLSTTGDENKFKYNGKELEDEHGLYWYHYGVRYYDPQLGRWHTTDPADEFSSPFQFVGNNPVLFIDRDGSRTDIVIKGFNRYTKTYEPIIIIPSKKYDANINVEFFPTGTPTQFPKMPPIILPGLDDKLAILELCYESLGKLDAIQVSLGGSVSVGGGGGYTKDFALFLSGSDKGRIFDYHTFSGLIGLGGDVGIDVKAIFGANDKTFNRWTLAGESTSIFVGLGDFSFSGTVGLRSFTSSEPTYYGISVFPFLNPSIGAAASMSNTTFDGEIK